MSTSFYAQIGAPILTDADVKIERVYYEFGAVASSLRIPNDNTDENGTHSCIIQNIFFIECISDVMKKSVRNVQEILPVVPNVPNYVLPAEARASLNCGKKNYINNIITNLLKVMVVLLFYL